MLFSGKDGKPRERRECATAAGKRERDAFDGRSLPTLGWLHFRHDRGERAEGEAGKKERRNRNYITFIQIIDLIGAMSDAAVSQFNSAQRLHNAQSSLFSLTVAAAKFVFQMGFDRAALMIWKRAHKAGGKSFFFVGK